MSTIAADSPPVHRDYQGAKIGMWLFLFTEIVLFGNLFRALFRGKPAPANPWGGVTLEWTIPSPPPVENFEEIPEIDGPPYRFNPEEAPRPEEAR